jgi:putative ABC transport system permease protein
VKPQRFRVSLALYRHLLRAYPAAFRARFGADMAEDFARMLAERGRTRAWRRIASDVAQSLPATHSQLPRPEFPAYEGEGVMGSLLFDFRHGVRMLLKAPVFTTIIVLTLALGIGANTAIFTLVNAVLLRPLGYADADRLMLIYEGSNAAKIDKFPVGVPDYLDIQQHQQSFETLAAFRNRTFELSGGSSAERIPATRISSSLLPVLGVSPMLGRNFTSVEDAEGHDLAILGYALWQRRFSGDPAVIGSRVLLDRKPHTIIGVMGPSFQFPRRGPRFNSEPADVYVPIAFTQVERQARGMMYNNGVIGRLKPGVSVEQAQSDFVRLSKRVMENYPPEMRNVFDVQIKPVPLRDEVAGQVRRPLLVLLGAVGLVLLIACANVANLILSRAAVREREIGLRAALGASRRRVLQMLLTENLVLAFAGAATGVLLARWVVQSVPSVIATSLPGVEGVTIDGRVLAFTLGLSILTAIFFGVVPMVAAGRTDLNAALREGTSRITGHHRQRLQRSLVVATVALAVVLLSGAGLLLRSFANLLAVDPGFSGHEALTLTIALPREAYGRADRIRNFYAELVQRAAAVPGVRVAGAASDLPMRGDEGERRTFTPEASQLPPRSIALTWALGHYFQALGVPVKRGRLFLPEEVAARRNVVVINEVLARRAWPGQDPLGKRLKWGGAISTAPWLTVVGVVADVNEGRPGTEPAIHAYEPYSQMPNGLLETDLISLGRTINLVVRGDGDPAPLLEPLRAEIARLDRALAISRVSTMRQQLDEAIAPQRFSTTLLMAFAGGALLLAAIGLYGVLAFGVAQRTREMGVRIALGASRREVLGLILGQGMTLVGIGLAVGIAGALAATRVMASLLYRTEPHDAWTFTLVPVVLAVVSLMACYLPARRASRVEPVVALRTE